MYHMVPSPEKLRAVGEEDKQALQLQGKVANTKVCPEGRGIAEKGCSFIRSGRGRLL